MASYSFWNICYSQFSGVLKFGVSFAICLFVLHFSGIVDSEWGARLDPHGVSIYLSLPYSRQEMQSFLTAISGFSILATAKIVYEIFRKASRTQIFRSTLFLYILIQLLLLGRFLFPIIRSSCPSPRSRLAVLEYLAYYGCENERYINLAVNMLSSAPQKPAVNTTSIDHFLHSPPPGIDRQQIARFQIVGSSVYIATIAPLSEASQYRCQSAMRGILSVLSECDMPDSEFILYVGDGFPGSFWPMSSPAHGDLYVPIFVQESIRGAAAFLAPPRSLGHYGRGKDLGEFTSLASFAAADNPVPWADRVHKAVWRGTPTGDSQRGAGGLYTASNWRDFTRSKAVMLSRRRPDLLDAGFSGSVDSWSQVDPAARREMIEAGTSSPPLSMLDQLRYKVVLMLEGNSLPDRFPLQLAGECVILKQDSPAIEFWYEDLIPWEHYIPIRADLGDLEDRLELVLSNETLMRRTARAGSRFALRRLRPAALRCYWGGLLGAYGEHVQQPVRPAAGAERYCAPPPG